MDFMTNTEREVARTHNSTFAIGGVSCRRQFSGRQKFRAPHKVQW
jgi:hypothetical protein